MLTCLDLSLKTKEENVRKYLLVLLLVIFIIPSIASASWYNPFSWFQKKTVQPPTPVTQVPVPTPTTPTNKQVEKVKVIPKKGNTQPTIKKIVSATSTPPVSIRVAKVCLSL